MERPDGRDQHVGGSDDGELIRLSLDDPSVFGELFERHATKVQSYLRTRVPDVVADDLLAQTFVTAFERRDGFRADASSALPWLLGIATNLARGHWRTEARRTSLTARLSGRREVSLEGHYEIDAVLARVDSPHTRAVIGESLARLRPAERDVLMLSAWEGLKNPEIAEALGIPVGTVKSRLSRARAAVATSLSDLTEGTWNA
ncbi:RNA polymerase sigma factor [Nocardioides yefusunii]|uniref:RNA polymerase sigma factor n=1 Tax=Nocardioides yefusunii TaxID=2500546 RepID=A0ABW1R2J3_9ACTN|nr:RNA polymerase sigma factor [Nocardioides yefusunii]